MISLSDLQKSTHFKTLSLSKGEILFNQGDFDSNLYIVVSGLLEIDAKIYSVSGEYKNIGTLYPGEILGEASLSKNEQKQARVLAVRDTTLLYINGETGFPIFLRESPELGYDLLLDIIEITNRRLLSANQEIRANHEVNMAISEIKEINSKNIHDLLEKFKTILGVEQIILLEKNIVMDEYFKLKYLSPASGELGNAIIKFPGSVFSIDILLEESIPLKKEFLYTSLHLGDNLYGFLIIGRNEKKFMQGEEKLLHNTASSLVGIIHRKEVIDEQKNKNLLGASRKYYQ